MKAFVTIVQHLDPNMFGVAQDQDQCRRWVASHWVQCSRVNEIEREGERGGGGNGKYLFFFTPALSLPLDIVFGSVERNEMKKGKLKSGKKERRKQPSRRRRLLSAEYGREDGCLPSSRHAIKSRILIVGCCVCISSSMAEKDCPR